MGNRWTASWKLGLVAGVGLLLGSAALGQGTPPQGAGTAGTDTEVKPALIQGYVVRAGSGEPLAKAQVMLRADQAQGRRQVYGAVTDVGGRFTLANIVPGSYRLEVQREGYVDQEYGQVSPSRPGTLLVLADGQQVQDVVIGLVSTGTITGRVFGEDGDPLVAATVQAMSFVYEDGERVLRAVSQAQTNDLGEYRLYWLDPGEYRVSARYQPSNRQLRELIQAVGAADPGNGGPFGLGLPGGRGRGGAAIDQIREALGGLADPSEEIYLDTYFPGTTDAVSSSPINVRPGSVIGGIDFAVLPTRTVSVSGTVVGPFAEGEPVNAAVTIVPRNSVVATSGGRGGRRGGGGGRGGDGTFRLTGVAPGSYTVVATSRSGGFGGRGRGGRGGRGGGLEMTGFVDIEVGDRDIEGLRIPLEAGVGIRGQVFVDQTANQLDVSRLQVRLEPLNDLPIGTPSGEVEDDGSFVIENVSPTTHRVVLRGLPAEAYVASARVGGQDVLESGVYVTASTPQLEFYVSGMGAMLDGTLALDPDQPLTGAQVVLIPANPQRADLYKVASVDQYGRFAMRGIAPGDYEVFAWEDAPAGAYEDPLFVRRYRDYGETVHVEQPGEQVQVEPRLIPAGL